MLEPGTRAIPFVRDAQLGTEDIEVQLVRATGAPLRRPLLLYATGDGGWRSADRGLFEHFALWGYPLAGFSARHYPEHLRFEATTPARVAEDYGDLIAFAKKALDLQGDTPTVLVGFSCGSGLAVIQSTEDSYLPASKVRQLFGPDTERRRFYPIRGGGHTFAGARDALYEQARVALEWIVASGSGNELARARRMP